jgi:FKBP-type peptidyl-prolyl cis-trans isomerase
MKSLSGIVIAILLSTSLGFAQSSTLPQQGKFGSFIDSASYAYGVAIGKNMVNYQLSLNNELIIQAIRDINNKISLYSDSTTTYLLSKLQVQLQEREKARVEVISKGNATKSAAFFEENAKKPSIKTTSSGLQYEEVVKGPADGASPSIYDTVVVNFEAKFIDGRILDSSYQDGKPLHMPLNQIIPGLQEGLLLMKPKDTFVLYIPSSLAYGDKGTTAVEPNQGLVFKIDLIDIIKGSAPLPKY